MKSRKKSFTLKMLSLLLCLVFVLSLTACRLPKIGRRQDPSQQQTESQQPAEPEEKPSEAERPEPVFPENPEESSLPEYEHYDASAFYEGVEKMLDYYEKEDADGVQKLYQKLLEELCRIDDMYCVAYIHYSENVNDSYFNEEMDYENELSETARDRLCTACHEMVTGKNPEVFCSGLDEEHITYFREYKPMSSEQIEYETRENDLVQQYWSRQEKMMDTAVTVGGKEYHLSDIYSDEGERFYEINPDLYLEVFAAGMEAYNREVGETFLKLLALRTEIAKASGYENYADYADDKIFFRKYSTEDMARFKETVKRYGENLIYYQAAFSSFNVYPLPEGTPDMEKTGEVLSGISKYAKDAYEFQKENNLLSWGAEKERMEGAYTIYLPGRRIPYTECRAEGDSMDAISFAHEFGHFTAYANAKDYDPITSEECLDLAEIHSQGLQLLFGEKAEPVFGSSTRAVQVQNVLQVALNVIDGCVLDDWQREVYSNPDMTLEEINDCYRRFMTEYGTYPYSGMEYMWCTYPHSFEAPMYYFGYASSSLGALQIWLRCLDNFETGVSVWEKLIEAGSFADYAETMEKAGLKPFYSAEDTDQILSDTLFYIVQAYYQSAME